MEFKLSRGRDAATITSEIFGSIDRLHVTGKKVSCKNCCMIERKTEPYESLDDICHPYVSNHFFQYVNDVPSKFVFEQPLFTLGMTKWTRELCPTTWASVQCFYAGDVPSTKSFTENL